MLGRILKEETLTGQQTNSTGESEEVIFAGTESDVRELNENVTIVHALSKTQDELSNSIALDRAGLESGTVNPQVVAQSLANFDSILALVNDKAGVVVGIESAESDPVAALEAGVEAKEGKIAKIVRYIKDFVKKQLLRLQRLGKDISNMSKLALVNAKALKDKADELEDTDTAKLSKDDDLKLHDSFIKKFGFCLDESKSIKENFGLMHEAIKSDYLEPTKTKVTGVIGKIKSADAYIKLDTFDNYLKSTKAIKDKLPATSAIRELADRTDIVGGGTFTTASKVEIVALTMTSGKDPKFEVVYEKETFKSDGVTYEKEIKGDDIKAVVTDLVDIFNKYDAKDVTKAVYGRLDTINKEASEGTKNMKAKYASRVMKFVSFYNTLATKSIDTLVQNQKSYYGAAKLIVNNVE